MGGPDGPLHSALAGPKFGCAEQVFDIRNGCVDMNLKQCKKTVNETVADPILGSSPERGAGQ